LAENIQLLLLEKIYQRKQWPISFKHFRYCSLLFIFLLLRRAKRKPRNDWIFDI